MACGPNVRALPTPPNLRPTPQEPCEGHELEMVLEGFVADSARTPATGATLGWWTGTEWGPQPDATVDAAGMWTTTLSARRWWALPAMETIPPFLCGAVPTRFRAPEPREGFGIQIVVGGLDFMVPETCRWTLEISEEGPADVFLARHGVVSRVREQVRDGVIEAVWPCDVDGISVITTSHASRPSGCGVPGAAICPPPGGGRHAVPLELAPPATIVVVDAAGAPIAGAQVTDGTVVRTSDPAGLVSWPGLEPAPALGVHAPDHRPAWAKHGDRVALQPGLDRTVRCPEGRCPTLPVCEAATPSPCHWRGTEVVCPCPEGGRIRLDRRTARAGPERTITLPAP